MDRVARDDSSPYPRCWCCGCLLTTKGTCPICDYPGLVSPPHACLKTLEVMTDEHGCEPEFRPLSQS